MTDRHQVGPDVDLDVEDIRDRPDRRITLKDEETLRLARPGRPSLGSAGQHSLRVSFRVPEQTWRRAEQRAAEEGRSVSEIGRDALERYLQDTG